MAATITSTSTRITINGEYKSFKSTVANTTTVIQFGSGEAPTSTDEGRFLMWKKEANTSDWEIRYIESATSTTVTVGDGGFSSAPSSGDENFVISTNLADIESAVPSACTSTGSSYSFNGRDFELASKAFLADVNKSLVMKGTSSSNFGGTYPVANNCAVQFGRLIGGEANDSTETIEGCQLSFEIINNNSLLFTTQGAVNTEGPVLNFYGCLLESFGNGFLPFIRSAGPMRLIGCICDGPMGGRLYSAASELVDTRFSGNTSGGIAWSLGGTFTRAIDNAFFFQGNTYIKAFQSFEGVFSNTKFADSNTYIIDSSGAGSNLLFTFVDCTTFADGKITNTRGQYKQAKSINYTITDSTGIGLNGAKLAIYDNTGDIQGGIENSLSGEVGQINAVFFDRPNGSTSTNKAPFDIRIRKYGYIYIGFQSSVAEPIKQEVRLSNNLQLSSTELQASEITGISLNFATSTATITSNHNAQSLYDYYQYQLAQTNNMVYGEDLIRTGISFDLDDWDMVVDGSTYTGDITTTGTITLANSGLIVGTATDSGGTTIVSKLTLIGLQTNSEVRVYESGTTNEIAGIENSTDTFITTLSASTVDIVVLNLQYLAIKIKGIDTTIDVSLPIQQVFDRQYENN